MHAREWITVATATYLLNELLTSNDPEMKELANNYDWVFVPVVNVDGYVYSHKSVRPNWTYKLRCCCPFVIRANSSHFHSNI